MFRFLIGSEAGDPDSFSVPFPGAEASLTNPEQLFILSPSHVAMPFYRTMTAAIARTIPFITPATISFLVASFTRASVVTVVNSMGLIEVVAPDTPRVDHDPASGAPKGLLLEESRTNFVRQSNELSNAAWGKFRITATSSPDFPIFASGNVFLLTENGVSGNKVAGCTFIPFTTPFTISIFMRRGSNNFDQLASYNYMGKLRPSNGSDRQCIGKCNSHYYTVAGRMV